MQTKHHNLYTIGMVVLWSIVFSGAMHNCALGSCMGACFGMLLSEGFDSEQDADGEDGNEFDDD